jgi:hypothetical protein
MAAPKARAMASSGQTPVSPARGTRSGSGGHNYPLTFLVDYPDRTLDRLTTAFRIFTIIPIAILAATIEGGGFGAQVMVGDGLDGCAAAVRHGPGRSPARL